MGLRARGAIVLALAGCTGSVFGLKPKAAAPQLARAAEFTLPAQDGSRVTLATELADRDVVLVFYRGHW